MKAIIPAAGLGTRLRPLTYSRPKPVLKVANKTIIQYAIDNLMEAGITDIGIVVSAQTLPDITKALKNQPGADITFILQHEQLGLGHAVRTAAEFVGQDDFCVYLGDNLFEKGIAAYREAFLHSGADAWIALKEVDNPSAFGVARLDPEGRIQDLQEKPEVPESNLAVAGMYFFRNCMMEHLHALTPGARGEYEITDAIRGLMAARGNVVGQRVEGWWKDTGRPEDLLDANRLVLETQARSIHGKVQNSVLEGRVVVEEGAEISDSIIRGPVLIGKNTRISHAYIGPYTSIGEGVSIQHSEIEFSVVNDEATIDSIDCRISHSIIGLKAQLNSIRERPHAARFIVADASQVTIPLM